jgi:hypothetical protein
MEDKEILLARLEVIDEACERARKSGDYAGMSYWNDRADAIKVQWMEARRRGESQVVN